MSMRANTCVDLGTRKGTVREEDEILREEGRKEMIK